MHTLKPKIRLLRALMGTAVCALAMIATTNVASAGEAPSGEIKTGNKPSTFNYRFNPYIRHNSFENDAEVTDMSVFAMVPVKWFGKDGAFVYEGPMSRDQDFSDIGAG